MTIDLDELERLAKVATPGPWRWWTSCSFRRLSSDETGSDGDVLHAVVHRDGVSDIQGSDADREFIAAANPETVLALVKRVRELEKAYQEECMRTSQAEDLLSDALASDLGWEDTEWGPKAAKIVGAP